MIAPSSTATVDVNQGEIVSSAAPTTKDVSTNSFRFVLENVSDAIPQGRLPQPDLPVLEFATDVEHDDVHSLGLKKTHLDNTNLNVSTYSVVVPVSNFVEHVDEHDDSASPNVVCARVVTPSLAHHDVSLEEVRTYHIVSQEVV